MTAIFSKFSEFHVISINGKSSSREIQKHKNEVSTTIFREVIAFLVSKINDKFGMTFGKKTVTEKLIFSFFFGSKTFVTFLIVGQHL